MRAPKAEERKGPVPGRRALGGGGSGLRSRRTGLKLPDALVLATTDELGAAAVLTADDAWTKVSRRARPI